jgi:CO/xanthine dehydrogenase FAD-binding subunit
MALLLHVFANCRDEDRNPDELMDLNSVETVVAPRTRAELPNFSTETAILGGGTWLFSEPQPHVHQLVDIAALGWKNLKRDAQGLHIAATCTIAALSRFVAPPEWRAAELIARCCNSLLGSFKVWNAATVGGNICLALPAGPMTALAAALQGVATIWCPEGRDRRMKVADLVIGDGQTALAHGEIMRSVLLPRASLEQACAFRQTSLTPIGRSAALLIGTRAPDGAFALTITAATCRPVRLAFVNIPTQSELAARIDAEAEKLWFDDVHGDPRWRRHISLRSAEDIRRELSVG